MTPAACENRQGKVGYEAHWPVGTLAFGLWHRFVSAALWALTSLGLVWPSGLRPRWVLSWPEAFDHAGSCLALRALTTLGLDWPSGL